MRLLILLFSIIFCIFFFIFKVKGDAYADMLVNALDNEIYKHVTLDDLPKWSELVKNGQKFSKYSNYGQNTPHTKEVIEAMDRDIMDHTMWDQWPEWGERMSNYFADDMVYDTNYYDGTNTFMGNGTGIRSWFDREHLPINLAFDNETFNPFIFASEEETATSTTYAIAPWTKGPFFGVGPAHKIIRYRDVDFYQMKDGKILYNWMILDSVLMLYEAGHNVLPNNMNPLKQGWVAPPTTMDGIPAPLSITVNPKDTIIAKKISLLALNFDFTTTASHPFPLWREDMKFYGSHGFGYAENMNEYYKYFKHSLDTAFSNRRIDLDMITCEGPICGAHGYLVGNFTGPFLGEKPSYTETRLRFGLHWNVDVKEKRIIEGYGVFDLPGFFIQAGIDLFKRAHLEQKSNSP